MIRRDLTIRPVLENQNTRARIGLRVAEARNADIVPLDLALVVQALEIGFSLEHDPDRIVVARALWSLQRDIHPSAIFAGHQFLGQHHEDATGHNAHDQNQAEDATCGLTLER